jgi:hypothetical protein
MAYVTRSVFSSIKNNITSIKTNVNSDSKCALFILDCNKDSNIISYLTGIAVSQKHNFIHIFPWQTKCSSKDKIYVSISLPTSLKGEINILSLITPPFVPDICGWMRVEFSKYKNLKIAHVHEISSSQNRIKYKGIGSIILKKLEEEKIDFVELIALPTAKSFYVDKMQYRSFDESLPYLFKVINKSPSSEYIQYLHKKIIQNEKTNIEMMQGEIQEILDDLDEKYKNKLIKILKENDYNKYIALELYQKGTIKDVVVWIDSN